ncbi:MAG: S8 family serine peptidase [Candidatus Kariarchaeaceae archaeon]|jgi:subtilisin family serine protease
MKSPIFPVIIIIFIFSTSLQLQAQTNLETIQAYEAWKITKGSEEITVAVLDAGISFSTKLPETIRWENNGELAGQVGVDDDQNGYIDDFYGWDFEDNDSDPSSDNKFGSVHWHGTSVTGVISAAHNGHEPYGIAPNVKIMNLRVGKGIEYRNLAIENNATVINMSIGFCFQGGTLPRPPTPQLLDMMNDAGDAKILIVLPSNNYDCGYFTAENENFTIATATDGDMQTRQPKYKIFAEGYDIPTVDDQGELVYRSGASFPVPQVTATIALMRSIRNDLAPSYIGQVLLDSATLIDGNEFLNVYQTVQNWEDFENKYVVKDGIISHSEEKEVLIHFQYFASIVMLVIIKKKRKTTKYTHILDATA